MKCKECKSCMKGYFTSAPDKYVCIGVKNPFIINDINHECTEYKNTVKKGCPFYDDSESCKKLQPKRNCYQCSLANVEIYKKDLTHLRVYCSKIEEENKELKYLLGEKILKEYQENQNELNVE